MTQASYCCQQGNLNNKYFTWYIGWILYLYSVYDLDLTGTHCNLKQIWRKLAANWLIYIKQNKTKLLNLFADLCEQSSGIPLFLQEMYQTLNYFFRFLPVVAKFWQNPQNLPEVYHKLFFLFFSVLLLLELAKA